MTNETEKTEWRWVDEKGRAMTHWNQNPPPPFDGVSDTKGWMRVETRVVEEPTNDT